MKFTGKDPNNINQTAKDKVEIFAGGSSIVAISGSGNVGIGTATPAYSLHNTGTTGLSQFFGVSPTLYVYNGRTAYDSTLKLENQSGDLLYFGGSGLLVTGNTTIGNGTATLSARLGVKGSGTTSSTTSLLVQDSSANIRLKVQDNGIILVGTGLSNTLGAIIRDSVYNTGLGIHGNDEIRLYSNNSVPFYTKYAGGSLPIKLAPYRKGVIIDPNTLNAASTGEPIGALHVIGAIYNTGSLSINTTVSSSALQVYKSGSTVLSVEGSQGSLMSVDDSLSGSLMSVGNISGLPLFEVFDDGTIVGGPYNQNTLVVTGSRVGIGTSTPAYNLDIITPTGSTTTFRAINPGAGGSVHRGGGILVTMLNTQTTGGRTRINQYDTAGYGTTNFIEFVSGTGGLTTEGSTYVSGFYEVGLGVGGTKRLSVNTSGVGVIGTFNASGVSAFASNVTVTGSLIASAFTASSAVINGNVTIHGTASVDVLITNYESSSIIYSSGSTKFGDTMDDTHQFTGSLSVTGSSVNLINRLTLVGYSPSPFTAYNGINTYGSMYMSIPNAGSDTIIVYRGNSSTPQWYLRGDGSLWSWGNTLLGASSISDTISARLHVKGSGTTSSTTALLVQNSAGTTSLSVTDTGSVSIANGLTVTGGPTTIGTNGTFYDIRLGGNDQYDSKITLNRMAPIILNAANWSEPGIIFSKGYSSPLGRIFLTSNFLIGGDGTTDTGYRLNITGSGTAGVLNAGNTLYVSGSNVGVGTSTPTAALQVYKSGSTVFKVEGSQGELFAITDSLSGSLFSVSNISGLPILEVFSDNTILLGDYQAPALFTTKTVTANSGSTVIYSIPTASYDGAFFEYTIKSGSNARAGSVMGMWAGTDITYTDNSTTDIGSTSGFIFGLILSGSNMVLTGSASTNGWNVKTIIKSI